MDGFEIANIHCDTAGFSILHQQTRPGALQTAAAVAVSVAFPDTQKKLTPVEM